MNNEIKKINVAPPLSVYQTFKGLGYDVVSAVSEFIDNSIASFRNHAGAFERAQKNGINIEKTIIVIFDKEKRQLVIRDTAYGIASKDYERALRIKSEPEDKSGLNEFGMGLKTASFWFGDSVEIITKTPADKNGIYAKGARLVLSSSDIKNGNTDIDAEPFDAENCAWKLNHGTVITVTGIDKDISDENAKKCVQKIASRYRRDIKNNGIKIFVYSNQDDETRLDVNAWTEGSDKRASKISRRQPFQSGKALSFVEPSPFVDQKTGETYKRQIDFTVEHEGVSYTVKGEVYLIIPGSRANAGFDLYRRGRIVVENFTDFIPNASGFDYQRVRGYLDLDNFPVSQAKDKIMWEGALFSKVFDQLRNLDAFVEMKKIANAYRIKTENKETDLFKSSSKFKDRNLNIAKGTTIASVADTIKLAEEKSLSFKATDVLHEVRTEKGVKKIYSRLEVEGMNSWMDVEEIDDVIVVRLDVNHGFFNPFNNLKENQKVGETFINTMREFAVYWAWAEKESKVYMETADEFRERLSSLIEDNKGE